MSFITSPGVIVPPLTAGGVAYGTGSQAKVNSAGAAGLFLQSDGAGVPVWAAAGLTLGTPVASTSGTAFDFTGIPASAKQIIISFVDVSTDGIATPLFQIGDAGGIEITNYFSFGLQLKNASLPLVDQVTNGFSIYANSTANSLSGSMVLTLFNPSTFTYVMTANFGNRGLLGSANNYISSGRKSLSQTLDRLRVTTVGETDTFDGGSINIAYI